MDPPIPFFPFPAGAITTTAVAAAAVPAVAQTQFLPTAPPDTTQNHTVHTTNETSPNILQSLNHPPYGDMIHAAITALNEKEGSSKRAIAKFIERVYPGLPPNHSVLLTHHLNRLKNSGLLVMVKKSYKLASSDPNYVNGDGSQITAVSSPKPIVGPKRGRGRPPKPKDGVVSSLQQPQPTTQTSAGSTVTVPVGLSVSTGQPTDPVVGATATADLGLQPGDSVKRGRGRPKKTVGAIPVAMKRRGRPPGKKSPGRPRKVKSVTSHGVRKVPKRLPKSVAVPYAAGAAGGAVVAKPRGRPRKVSGGATVAEQNRPGRPPKVVADGLFVNPNKKRPGRPKKNATVSWAPTDAPQLQAYEALKSKVELFQSTVMEAVGVLRPHITNETPIDVVIAIQDLEGLASMEVSAPIREEAPQPPLPPPPAQPQQPQPQPQPQPPVIQH